MMLGCITLFLVFLFGSICTPAHTKALANFDPDSALFVQTVVHQRQKREIPISHQFASQHYPRFYRDSQQKMDYNEAIDLLLRVSRSPAKRNEEAPSKPCKYKKGTWSACDPNSNSRTRTDTLRKGDSNICEGIKTRKKDCKTTKKAKQRNNAKGRGNKLKKE